LLSRPENPRRVITERFVPRGSLLDREDELISGTAGNAGDYYRDYQYPQLSSTTGYNSPLYGQSGLEAGLDDILRGLRGSPPSLVFFNDLLYGQPPPGLDVRLSIDLDLQERADELLAGHAGALVLLNASTGETLVMASHPNFDPNQLEEVWFNMLQDPNAPLLNRATQGRYSPGTALGPFLLAYAARDGELPTVSGGQDYSAQGERWTCAAQPSRPLSIGRLIANGCPGPLVTLGESLGAEALQQLYESLGFTTAPAVPLQVAIPSTSTIARVDLAAIGQENLSVTPLQMALAAAAISNEGVRPSPILALSMRTPDEGWVTLQPGPKEETLLAGGADLASSALAQEDAAYWHTVALARSSTQEITWFLAGSLPDKPGAPFALALVLEESNPSLAEEIGQAMMELVIR
jgi:peptidoglycan glycosyltransferase